MKKKAIFKIFFSNIHQIKNLIRMKINLMIINLLIIQVKKMKFIRKKSIINLTFHIKNLQEMIIFNRNIVLKILKII